LKLVFAARLVVEKGVQVVLDAMQLLPAHCRVELHLAGRGPLEARVTEAAAANPAIRFHGFVSGDAKHALLSQADAMLLPSLWFENAPVVIVEAAAYGLGVVGSRLGAIPEFIDEGRNGLLFEAGSADDLARAIVRLHDDPALRATFAAEGRRWAEGFSVGAMADRYLEIYGELVGPGGRRAGAARRGPALQAAELSP
jgi:glycosyltransferase involved in cell wall biosynthesis